MLGPMLVSVHNLAYYQRLMRELRAAILADDVMGYRERHLAQAGGA
jgi:queuine tRNA-ribosyltransferase